MRRTHPNAFSDRRKLFPSLSARSIFNAPIGPETWLTYLISPKPIRDEEKHADNMARIERKNVNGEKYATRTNINRWRKD